MELNDLLVETAAMTATYKTHEFKLNVFTEILTPEYKARLIALTTINKVIEAQTPAKAADDATDAEPVATVPSDVLEENCKMLSDLIDSWDVVLKGEPFPPTYENFLTLSYPLMATLITQITTWLGDLANPQKPTTSPTS